MRVAGGKKKRRREKEKREQLGEAVFLPLYREAYAEGEKN